MPKFSIAFITPDSDKPLRHRLVDGSDQEAALRKFFEEETAAFYSNDDQGYHYFKEDFFDSSNSIGSLIALE